MLCRRHEKHHQQRGNLCTHECYVVVFGQPVNFTINPLILSIFYTFQGLHKAVQTCMVHRLPLPECSFIDGWLTNKFWKVPWNRHCPLTHCEVHPLGECLTVVIEEIQNNNINGPFHTNNSLISFAFMNFITLRVTLS